MPLTQAFEPKRVYREQQTVVLGLVPSATQALPAFPSATQAFAPKSVYREQRQAEMPFARYE